MPSSHLGLFQRAWATSPQLNCWLAPRGMESSIPRPWRAHLWQSVTDSQNPLGDKHSVPPSLIQLGKLRHREEQGLAQHHTETLCEPSQPKSPVQLHVHTSLSESLVATLLNPAEQLTAFHAIRESGQGGGESGINLPPPRAMGSGLQPCCSSSGERSPSASLCLAEPGAWWAVGLGGLNSTLRTRGGS